MVSIPALVIIAALQSAVSVKAADPPDERAGVVRERDDLFATAAMAYVHANQILDARISDKAIGQNNAAIIAWNVDDIENTPSFLIDRDRTIEKGANMYSAELVVMERTSDFFELHHPPSLGRSTSPGEQFRGYDGSYTNSTMYTAMEPCPDCVTAMLLNRIPRAVYCVDDPNLRDIRTHEPNVAMPSSIFGRTVTKEKISSNLCDSANNQVWNDARYLPFAAAYATLAGYTVQYCENTELLERLKEIFGPPMFGPGRFPIPFESPRTLYNDDCPNGKYFNGTKECVYPRTTSSRAANCPGEAAQ